MSAALTAEQLETFQRDGFVVARGFYEAAEIEPIQRGVHAIIGLVIAEEGLAVEQPPFAPENFDGGFQELIAHDRALGGRVYDAVKQIPAFIRMVASAKHEAVVRQVRATDQPAIAAGGSASASTTRRKKNSAPAGIRITRPKSVVSMDWYFGARCWR
jgi:hypothetical protein